MEKLEMFSKIVDILWQGTDFEVQINSIIETICAQTGFCRAYIFVVDENDQLARKEFQWGNPDFDSKENGLDKISFETMEMLKRMFNENGKLYTENIEELPTNVVDSLMLQGVSSVAAFPFFISNNLAGFIGFSSFKKDTKWNEEDLQIFKIISSILSGIYEKNYSIKKINEDKENFQLFFDTIDDFIFIGNYSGEIIFTNKAVNDKLGFINEELLNMKIIEMHPSEKRDEAQKILNEMFSGKRQTCPIEIMAKDGTVIPVETRVWFGKWNNKDCVFGICKNLSKEQEALQKFTNLFENNPALMAVTDLSDKTFADINNSFMEKIGYSYEEIIGKTSEELNLFIVKDERKRIEEELISNKKFNNLELHIRCKDGKMLTGLFSGEIIHSQKGKYLLTIMVDITEQKKVQNLYEKERIRLESIIECTGLGTWEWNVQTGETIFNERWAGMIGYSLDEIQPVSIETWRMYTHPDDFKVATELLEKHFRGECDYYNIQCRMKHKEGHWVWIQDRGRVVEWDGAGKPLKMYGTHSDITEIKENENKIVEISNRDPLTNIYNRRYIFERLEKDIERFQRKEIIFAVSILDIDHFKKINDKFGHLAGDYILKEFTSTISENLRDYDLLGRFGGEEFIIIMYDANKIEAQVMINRIMEIVREKIFVYDKQKIKFKFSAGISDINEFSHKKTRSEDIISLADKRLYLAKAKGRDRIETDE